jgi:hypothetical protein
VDDDFSLSMEINFSSLPGYNDFYTFWAGGNFRLGFFAYSPNLIEWFNAANSSWYSWLPFNPSANTWYKIEAKRVGASISVYVDGGLIGSSTYSSGGFSGSRFGYPILSNIYGFLGSMRKILLKKI